MALSRSACLLAGVLALWAVGCTSDDTGGPIDPPGPPQAPNPPNFGTPVPGQTDALRVVARVAENDKKAPFTAELIADITGGLPPFIIDWDVDSDGQPDTFGAATTSTFASSGDFNANVKVTDVSGATASSTVEIHVLPPGPNVVVTANDEATLLEGSVPLNVQFDATGSTGVITKFEWDFLGDGIIAVLPDLEDNPSFTYTAPGTYAATVRATDEEGNSEDASILIIVTF